MIHYAYFIAIISFLMCFTVAKSLEWKSSHISFNQFFLAFQSYKQFLIYFRFSILQLRISGQTHRIYLWQFQGRTYFIMLFVLTNHQPNNSLCIRQYFLNLINQTNFILNLRSLRNDLQNFICFLILISYNQLFFDGTHRYAPTQTY